MLAVLLVFTAATVLPLMVKAQTYSISFTVVGLPSGVKTRYYVDGILNGTIQTGEVRPLNFTPGPVHMLSVDIVVSGGNGARYQCRENLWSFSDAGIHTFSYNTQYYLEVLSPYGSPSGTGWYNESATAYARIAKNMTEGPEGVRYVFAKWEGEASGQNIVSDGIIMDHPKKAVAAWKTQYRLRISSDPVEILPPSTLWFDAGSLAEFLAPNGTASPDTRYVFTQWVGDYAGSSPGGSIQMDSAKSVTAKYKTQYLLSIAFTPSEVAQEKEMPRTGWYDAGSTATLGPVTQTVTVSSVERLAFISWNVDGMIQQGTSIDVRMDGPHHVEVTYRAQYYLEVTSLLGETTGSGWYFSGEKTRFGVTYRGSDFPVKYTLSGWQSSPSAVITTVSATEAEINMDRPYVVEAVWSGDYTPAWIFLFVISSVVIALTAVAVFTVKKPGSLGRLMSSFKHGFRTRKVSLSGAAMAPPTSLVACQRCGARVPSSAEYCHFCGASMAVARAAEPADLEAVDEQVYQYILKRHGEISLSRASKDLGLSVDELKISTERLKKKRRLE